MPVSLESSPDRAVNPVVGVFAIVVLSVVCSAAFGTFLIGFGSDLESDPTPRATVEIETLVQDETDGFVTLAVRSMARADRVVLAATTADGSATLADGTPDGAATLTERRGAPGDAITVRKDVDPDDPRDVSVRLVAVAQYDGAQREIFDRTVTL